MRCTRADRDGGLGWIVVLGSFLVHNIVLGTQFSFGIFFVEIVKAFDSNEGSAAWIPSLAMGFMMGTSPFTGVLVRRYSARAVALAGSFVAGAGMAIASQSTQLWHVAVCYGVISGVGFSLAYVPSIVVLAHYWETRRSLATGIAVAGSGTGTLVMAAVTDALLRSYTWQEALFIVGMICMVVVACCACLYLPALPAKMPELSSPHDKLQPETGKTRPAQHTSSSTSFSTSVDTTRPAGPIALPVQVHLPMSRAGSSEANQNPVAVEMVATTLTGDEGTSLDSASWSEGADLAQPGPPATESDMGTGGNLLVATCGDPGSAAAHASHEPVRVQLEQPGGSADGNPSATSLSGGPSEGDKGVQGGCDGPEHGDSQLGQVSVRSLSDEGDTEVQGATAPSVEVEPVAAAPAPETMPQVLQRIWRIRKYRCLVFALGPTALGYLTPYTHLKAFAISPALEFSSADAALALSAVGIASVFGRVAMGRLADMRLGRLEPHIVRNWLFLLSGFGAGLSVAGLGAAYTLGGLIAAAIGFGVFSGAILSVMPVITADAVGVADLPVALPIMYFVQVPGFVVGAPIAGWVKVAVGSYRPAFALSGALMLLGAFALLPLAWDRSPRMDDTVQHSMAKYPNAFVEHACSEETAASGPQLLGTEDRPSDTMST